MKTACFFAHYDSKNKIADYVLDYLKFLKEISDDIYFVSDCPIEKNQLPRWVNIIYANHHGEYDFGSWKRCFKAVDLRSYHQLILANDSCFCTRSLKYMVEKASLDFFGICETSLATKGKHRQFIPSYFFVFKKQTFPDLADWFQKITSYSSKQELCEKTEYALTNYLKTKKFKYSTYVGKVKASDVYSDRSFGWCPLIKRAIFDKNPNFIANLDIKIKTIDYPIMDYLLKYKTNLNLLALRLSGFNFSIFTKYFIYIKGGYKENYKNYRSLIKIFGIPVIYFKICNMFLTKTLRKPI